MSLSVSNGGIGKSPAISRLNRFSPKKESKMISENMRSYIQPKKTRSLSLSSDIRVGSEKLWNPSASPSLSPYYPATKLNVTSFKTSVSNMVLQPMKEFGGRSNANSTFISGQIANQPAGRFFSGSGIGSGGSIPVSRTASDDPGQRGLFSVSDLQSSGQTPGYGRDDQRR